MRDTGEWSPDEPSEDGTLARDDADLDAEGLDALTLEEIEEYLVLEPSVIVDERELEELGAEFDDPEQMVMLQGGVDDPDGLGEPSSHSRARRADLEGWDLDQPTVEPT